MKSILLRLAELTTKYLVYEGYSYNEYADCDPYCVARDIANLPSECKKIPTKGNDLDNKEMYSGYWSVSRPGSNGMDGDTVEKIDFTVWSGVYSDDE